MRLLFTLRHGSVPGNCGGDLRLFFTTLNTADWAPAPPGSGPILGRWLPSDNKNELLRFPSGDTVDFNLAPLTLGEGSLWIGGAIIVNTTSGKVFGAIPMGQAPPKLFLPGQQYFVVLQDRLKTVNDGVAWDLGFALVVPWDGESAYCTGHWWARWHPVP